MMLTASFKKHVKTYIMRFLVAPLLSITPYDEGHPCIRDNKPM